jgi:cytochrome c
VGVEPWGRWPPGRAIGNYWPYATTLFDYIRKAMPQATPGVLTPDETYSVIAYILNLNGLVPEDATMNAETLPVVVMPARDRFVADDRRGGAEVR